MGKVSRSDGRGAKKEIFEAHPTPRLRRTLPIKGREVVTALTRAWEASMANSVVEDVMGNQLVSIARVLRKRMTPQEAKLWIRLRAWLEDGYKFRRQVPLGPYIVDFACYDPRLVIEVDGGQHSLDSNRARDAKRDQWLGEEGFRVIRVWNMDVDTNMDGVMTRIHEELEERDRE
jgi:very-short-patch-repair endonuclease